MSRRALVLGDARVVSYGIAPIGVGHSRRAALMEWMTRSDIILLAVAAYVAVMTLVRLMKRRHDELVADVQRQMDARRANKQQQESTNQSRGAA